MLSYRFSHETRGGFSLSSSPNNAGSSLGSPMSWASVSRFPPERNNPILPQGPGPGRNRWCLERPSRPQNRSTDRRFSLSRTSTSDSTIPSRTGSSSRFYKRFSVRLESHHSNHLFSFLILKRLNPYPGKKCHRLELTSLPEGTNLR